MHLLQQFIEDDFNRVLKFSEGSDFVDRKLFSDEAYVLY